MTHEPVILGPCTLYSYQWYGRQVFTELRNDFHFSRKLHRVVYHLSDFCKAPNESAAKEIFKREYPDAQETGFFCVGMCGRPRSGRELQQQTLKL